ncbi:DUF4435 domain-containing protein [Burkholderia gladioli]|uniref:DUF4435 domain-containing protein n=1 Tax=Burkholderia gladioli TaxID=28095 RepID=UPI00163EFC68|nr:DUF4435 domain-containing protein [Burkholderia gladioli]
MSDDFDFPMYGRDGGAARDIFLADSVDILFYFEDEGQEFVYDQLISKVGIRENYAVVCAGGKTKYKEIFRETSSARRIFVCDKDYDDLTGEASEYVKYGFVYLGRFCFENYLLSEASLIRTIVEEARLISHEVASKIDLYGFISRLMPQYEKLSRIYAVARKNRILIPTTKVDAEALVADVEENDEPIPTDDYIESVRRRLIGWCEGNNHWITDENTLSMEEASAFSPSKDCEDIADGSPTTHLCGKHLLRLTLLFIDRTFGTKLIESDFALLYSRMISHSDALIFDPIRVRLDTALRA